MPNFRNALKLGQKVELFVLNRIQAQYPKACIIQGSFAPFDIYIPETHTRVEVKSDQKSQYTGNILIEVYHFGKPSAILATEADKWVFYDGKKLIWVNPLSIKDLILKNGYKQQTLTGEGDNIPKRCYLVPKQDIVEISDYVEIVHENKSE